MKKCKECKKHIPTKEDYFSEYFQIIKSLEENKENSKKIKFFNLMIKNMESHNETTLCTCSSNFEEKKNLYSIFIDKTKNYNKKVEVSEIINNGLFNIVKNKLTSEETISFLKSEKMYFTSNVISTKFLKYETFKSYVKIQTEHRSSENIESLKKEDILLIYDFKPDNTKKEFYYYDEKLVDILKTRLNNKKTTYILYNVQKKTDDYMKIINEINQDDVRDFYKSSANVEDEMELKKSTKKSKDFELK